LLVWINAPTVERAETHHGTTYKKKTIINSTFSTHHDQNEVTIALVEADGRGSPISHFLHQLLQTRWFCHVSFQVSGWFRFDIPKQTQWYWNRRQRLMTYFQMQEKEREKSKRRRKRENKHTIIENVTESAYLFENSSCEYIWKYQSNALRTVDYLAGAINNMYT